MHDKEKFLPIGSIVLLKGGTKKLMITGYCMKIEEEPDKIYDYNGCLYPEGVLTSDVTSVFDHQQIDEVFFVGFENNESKEFREEMQNKLLKLEKLQVVEEN